MGLRSMLLDSRRFRCGFRKSVNRVFLQIEASAHSPLTPFRPPFEVGVRTRGTAHFSVLKKAWPAFPSGHDLPVPVETTSGSRTTLGRSAREVARDPCSEYVAQDPGVGRVRSLDRKMCRVRVN